jgi:hypothetical protein
MPTSRTVVCTARTAISPLTGLVYCRICTLHFRDEAKGKTSRANYWILPHINTLRLASYGTCDPLFLKSCTSHHRWDRLVNGQADVQILAKHWDATPNWAMGARGAMFSCLACDSALPCLEHVTFFFAARQGLNIANVAAADAGIHCHDGCVSADRLGRDMAPALCHALGLLLRPEWTQRGQNPTRRSSTRK